MELVNRYEAGKGFPGLRDVVALYQAITIDRAAPIQIRLEPIITKDLRPVLWCRVILPIPDDPVLGDLERVLASKWFTEQGYLISWGQLCDLLIVAYRTLEGDSAHLDPNLPDPADGS